MDELTPKLRTEVGRTRHPAGGPERERPHGVVVVAVEEMCRITEPHPQPRDRVRIAVGILEVLADSVTIEPLEQFDRQSHASHRWIVVDHDRDRDRLADRLEVGVKLPLGVHLIPRGDEQDPVVARPLGELAPLDGVGRGHPGPTSQKRHAATHLILDDAEHLLPFGAVEVHEFARARPGAEAVGAAREHELDVVPEPRLVDGSVGGERCDEWWVEAPKDGTHGETP